MFSPCSSIFTELPGTSLAYSTFLTQALNIAALGYPRIGRHIRADVDTKAEWLHR